MRIYLAARYSKHPEMQGVRDLLQVLGHEVTSRWIDQHGGDQLESATHAQLNSQPEACQVYGQHDMADIDAADVVISFTYPDGGGKGGRHIEFGYALGTGKRMILVGPRENIFHTLPQVEHFPDWRALALAMSMSFWADQPSEAS
jgi:nucleoside 2-deoxyribosyltransferase